MKAETTQTDRAELLRAVRQEAYGKGIDILRSVLRDLDRAEAENEKMHEALTKIRDYQEHGPQGNTQLIPEDNCYEDIKFMVDAATMALVNDCQHTWTEWVPYENGSMIGVEVRGCKTCKGRELKL